MFQISLFPSPTLENILFQLYSLPTLAAAASTQLVNNRTQHKFIRLAFFSPTCTNTFFFHQAIAISLVIIALSIFFAEYFFLLLF